MVVKLYFTDQTNIVRTFTTDELFSFRVLDKNKLLEYFEENLNLSHPVEDWEFTTHSEKHTNIYRIDLRPFINKYTSFIGIRVDGRLVESYEFLKEDSYEYGLASLENLEPDLYFRNVMFDFDYSVPAVTIKK